MNADKPCGPPTRKRATAGLWLTMFIAVCCIAIAGCSVNQEIATADEMTIDTVGVEWMELVKQPAAERRTFTQEEIDRRQRKFDAWLYRVKKQLGNNDKKPAPLPTEDQIAEATLKDLGRSR